MQPFLAMLPPIRLVSHGAFGHGVAALLAGATRGSAGPTHARLVVVLSDSLCHLRNPDSVVASDDLVLPVFGAVKQVILGPLISGGRPCLDCILRRDLQHGWGLGPLFGEPLPPMANGGAGASPLLIHNAAAVLAQMVVYIATEPTPLGLIWHVDISSHQTHVQWVVPAADCVRCRPCRNDPGLV